MGNKPLSSTEELTHKTISENDQIEQAQCIVSEKSSHSVISSRQEDIQSPNIRDSDRAAVRNMLTLQWEGGSLERRQRREAKMNISALETELGAIIAEQNYPCALDKLFEILFLSKKAFGNQSDHTAYTLHRMSSVLCLLGRLEEALKYESESCAIRKAITANTGPDSMIGKSLVYIAKLLWHFRRFQHGFHAILEAYNIAEQLQTNQIELRVMVGAVALEMSDVAHQGGHYHLAFKLRILAFQSKRAAFLQEESQFDESLITLSKDLWNYKDGVMLLSIIPFISKVELSFKQQSIDSEEESCPICFGEFNESDNLKSLLCDHTFHGRCIDQWIVKSQKCPMCRQNQTILEMIELHKDPQKMRITPAGMEFLKSDAMKKTTDQFMYDYSSHFNLFPLPQTQPPKAKESAPINESAEDQKQLAAKHEEQKKSKENQNNLRSINIQQNKQDEDNEEESKSDFSPHEVSMMNCNSEGANHPLSAQCLPISSNNRSMYFRKDEEDETNIDEGLFNPVAQEPPSTSSLTSLNQFQNSSNSNNTTHIHLHLKQNNKTRNTNEQPTRTSLSSDQNLNSDKENYSIFPSDKSKGKQKPQSQIIH